MNYSSSSSVPFQVWNGSSMYGNYVIVMSLMYVCSLAYDGAQIVSIGQSFGENWYCGQWNSLEWILEREIWSQLLFLYVCLIKHLVFI